MSLSPRYLKHLTIVSMGFLVVLILAAMSALGFADERRGQPSYDAFAQPIVLVLDR